MNFIPTLFFWQFWQRYTTRWVIVIYMYLQSTIWKASVALLWENHSHRAPRMYTWEQILLWTYITLSSDYEICRDSLYSKHCSLFNTAQKISKPFLPQISPLCRLFKAFHPYPNSLSFTNFFAAVSSLSPWHSTFSEDSWVSNSLTSNGSCG